MRLREKGKKDGEIITLGWDEAQTALQAGTHEVADDGGDGRAISGEKGPAAEHDVSAEVDAKADTEADARSSGSRGKMDMTASRPLR